MDIDIGAKRPINGDQIFVVGRCRWPSEPQFVTLYDPSKQRESKRNLQRVESEQVVHQLGGTEHFVSIIIPIWGTAWFRRSSIRKINEMSPRHLQLSSTETIGSRILFTHQPDEDEEVNFPGSGFSLYGISVAQASEALRC